GASTTSLPTLSLHDALPICLPTARTGSADGPRAHAGVLAAIDDRWFYVRGWTRSPGEQLSRLTAVAPEGARAELLATASRHPRPDRKSTRLNSVTFRARMPS